MRFSRAVGGAVTNGVIGARGVFVTTVSVPQLDIPIHVEEGRGMTTPQKPPFG
jgi:hypothetical protein